MITYCLGDFAKRLQRTPKENWERVINELPERCPRDCAVDCRPYCRQYARDQWRLLQNKGIRR